MAYFDSLPWDEDPTLAEQLMQAKVAELVERYGLADGEVSAIYYDELMALQGASVPPAAIAEPRTVWAAQDTSDALRHATTPVIR